MPEQQKSTPLNLSHYTEAIRREIYDRVAAMVWTKDSPDDYIPSATPAQAGLMVFYAFGRWFATWSHLEPSGPGAFERRVELVRVQESHDTGYGIILAEV